ncbi:hypothetical protein RE433_28930 (plasmid) [Bacillus cereus]|uniref:hypothetical protein n=1 Tax=Bacillus cereus TaxID=1396 RepID=UPI00286810C1|nr:hypothetical protein [Bacillus cereus]WMW41365.1 hypothetical protein RE433_28930 [Bacillus cereus]
MTDDMKEVLMVIFLVLFFFIGLPVIAVLSGAEPNKKEEQIKTQVECTTVSNGTMIQTICN